MKTLRHAIQCHPSGLLLAVLLTLTTLAHASQFSGQPLIATGASGNASDPAGSYVDAYIYTNSGTGGTCTTSDMCCRIQYVWTHLPTGTGAISSTTVDARGFNHNTSTAWTCGTNPFPTGGTTVTYGRLLLGNVTIPVSTGWVVPAGTTVEGLGNSGPSGTVSSPPINTVLQAQTGLSGAVINMGDNSLNSQFGVKIKSLTVDCANITGCIGIYNNTAQEDSTVESVVIQNAPIAGLSIVASCNSGCQGAVNSGPYRNITVEYGSGACGHCGSSTVGISITGQDDATIVRGLDNVTVSANNLNTGVGIKVAHASTRISNSHVEYYPSGIIIGAVSGTTRGVQVQNVSVGHASNSNITILTGSSDIVLEGITNRSSSTILVDGPGGNTLTSPEDDFLALYALGHSCTNTCPNQTYPAVISTSPAVQVQIPGGIRTP